MTFPALEGEAIARIVQGCCQAMEGGMGHCDQYDAADAILALRQPGAEYRRALEDAASLAETIPPRDIGDRLFDAHVLTGARIATAIRALASDD